MALNACNCDSLKSATAAAAAVVFLFFYQVRFMVSRQCIIMQPESPSIGIVGAR